MIMNKELIELIKNKHFDNFWVCFDYLLIAGYSEKEAISLSINEFGRYNIFNQVAFIGMVGTNKNTIIRLDDIDKTCMVNMLKVGLFNEQTIHLDGMYAIYRKWLVSHKYNNFDLDIEEPCDKITIENLSHETLEYFLYESEKYFGFEAFRILPIEEYTPYRIEPVGNEFRGYVDLFANLEIPPNLLGRNEAE